ncbi:MAG: hypothetical protein QOG16_290 [Actinomycetota bacterium]|nr:hypothetical protein [Actinomycetota bacterium]
MNLLINGPYRHCQYTETLVDARPFHDQQCPRQSDQGEDPRTGSQNPGGRFVPYQRAYRQDRHAGRGEQRGSEDRDVPKIVSGQWEVTEAKWNSPTLIAGATVEPNEV